MLSRNLFISLTTGRRGYSDKIDFVQQLFVDKLREYRKKKQESGDTLFDADPKLLKEKEFQHEMALKMFFKESPPSDPTKFPTFEFKDEKLDDINLSPKE